MNRLIALIVSCGFFALGAPYGHAAENDFFSRSQRAPATDAKSASAQNVPTIASLNEAENAVVDIWKRLPFTVRNSMFVTKPAAGYGGYEKRPSNVFVPGEKLLTYAEPTGYKWEETSEGSFHFGFTTDFELLTPSGEILGGQRAFQSLEFTTHARNRELFLNLTITIGGLKPGNYVLAFVIHDKVGAGTTRTELPFAIKEP
jgi:hypothetical protein